MAVALRDRGWAQTLLQWRWEGATLLTAEIAVARYFVRGDPHEILAWCELRELGSWRRCEVGSFPAAAAAKAACERHAAGLCVREPEMRNRDNRRSSNVAIATPPRESSRKPAKPARATFDTVSKAERPREPGGLVTATKPARVAWGTSPACVQRRARREPLSELEAFDHALASLSAVIGEE